MEVVSGDQPRPFLEDGDHQLLGGARVAGGLEDDRRPRCQVAGQRGRRVLDEGQVGHALLQRGGHVDDGHVEAGHGVGVVGGVVAAGGQRRRELAGR